MNTHTHTHTETSPYTCLSRSVSVCLSVCPSLLSVSVCLSACLSVSLPLSLSLMHRSSASSHVMRCRDVDAHAAGLVCSSSSSQGARQGGVRLRAHTRARAHTHARAHTQGFYAAATAKAPDRVVCFACENALTNWDPTDDPWQEHQTWYPQVRTKRPPPINPKP